MGESILGRACHVAQAGVAFLFSKRHSIALLTGIPTSVLTRQPKPLAPVRRAAQNAPSCHLGCARGYGTRSTRQTTRRMTWPSMVSDSCLRRRIVNVAYVKQQALGLHLAAAKALPLVFKTLFAQPRSPAHQGLLGPCRPSFISTPRC